MKVGNSLNVESVILCDDIRREDNGKHMLIGVYSGGMLLPSPADNMSLSIYLLAKFDSNEIEHFEISLSRNGKPLGSGGLELSPPENPEKSVAIALPDLTFDWTKSGTLEFRMKPDQGRWKKLASIPIEISEQDT